jgi:hypothetical protein
VDSDRSDDALRSIVFGPGHSAEEVEAATAELLRRSRRTTDEDADAHGTADQDSADADHHPDEQHSAEEASVASSVDASTRWPRSRAVLAYLAAFAIGIAGTAAVLHPWGPETSTEDAPADVTTILSNRGDVVYEAPSTTGSPNTVRADALLDTRQSQRDASLSGVNYVDRASAHYLGSVGTLTGVWVARSLDLGYCIVMVDSQETVVSSCVDGEAFDRSGVSVAAQRYQAYWNGDTGILSVTG